jgi:hypothetical protein
VASLLQFHRRIQSPPRWKREGQDPRGYVAGLGGFATSLGTAGNTTGDVRVEGGVRIAPHMMVIANVGRL